MKKIKVAQIGTSVNSHGSEIFNFMKTSPLFDVVGYCFPEGEREKFPNKMYAFEGCKELTLEEILNNDEIEAVTIETEEIYLTKYAQMVADKKKHIHMEKPGSQNLEDFEKLIETVKKNGTVFHTGYMYRYNPYISKLIKRLKGGELGEIISVEAQMSCKHSDEIRDWLTCFEGGIMFFLGCHLVDLVMQIQGAPKNIIQFNKCTQMGGAKGQDYSFAAFEYEKGVSFIKTTSVERGGFLRRQLVVTGTKGMIEVKPLETTVKYPRLTTSYKEIIGDDDWNANADIVTSEEFDRYTDMITAFGKMVRGEIENPYTYDYELELYKTILKCCK